MEQFVLGVNYAEIIIANVAESYCHIAWLIDSFNNIFSFVPVCIKMVAVSPYRFYEIFPSAFVICVNTVVIRRSGICFSLYSKFICAIPIKISLLNQPDNKALRQNTTYYQLIGNICQRGETYFLVWRPS